MGDALPVSTPILELRDVTKSYRRAGTLFARKPTIKAVSGVSLTIQPGETLGLVGESGSGKSTLARLVMQLTKSDAGKILIDGVDATRLAAARKRMLRRSVQMIFQDPYTSLNPRMRIVDIIAEPMHNFATVARKDMKASVAALAERVGLGVDFLSRYPHELSGGQRQRVAIARALALYPKLIICDEAVSSLDVSLQAQILNLLADLQREHGLSLLFVSHDLAVVQRISQRVAVMYLGRIVEIAAKRALFARPTHPYTQALIAAVPVLDPTKRKPARANEPEPATSAPDRGCAFQNRCPLVVSRCRDEAPILHNLASDHAVACHVRTTLAN